MASNLARIKFDFFVDRANVRKRVSASGLRVLAKQGAYLRRKIRQSMKYRKKETTHSKPGQPPRYHERGKVFNIRNRIFFAVDPRSQSVVVGPGPKTHDIAELHEFGGVKNAKAPVFKTGDRGPVAISDGKPVILALRSRRQARRARRLMAQAGRSRNYPSRPFVGPTFVEERDKLDSFWRDQVRR